MKIQVGIENRVILATAEQLEQLNAVLAKITIAEECQIDGQWGRKEVAKAMQLESKMIVTTKTITL
jgi:hypothetical protein